MLRKINLDEFTPPYRKRGFVIHTGRLFFVKRATQIHMFAIGSDSRTPFLIALGPTDALEFAGCVGDRRLIREILTTRA